ncbi:helicase-like protein [Mumia flava]|uniref:Helicase-like protein n=1 Tax=Mumia flava TaxID=1348852 RepID=A0A0B2BT96_9ACTN|nr:helicase-related protein [Mumia flava]PJJ53766.1 helicase-like protein [Mumia flava]
MTQQRPDVNAEIAKLKDFQRDTVNYVHDRLWSKDDPTTRFLVADEVGLGKTMVARGVIAKAIDHMWDTIDRIDVVYICSNAQIAQQNLRKLLMADSESVAEATRLTMLSKKLRNLRENKVNFVSFSPGTSFELKSSGGHAPERVLLYWMLAAAWGHSAVRSRKWLQFFRAKSSLSSFEQQIKWFDRSEIPPEMAEALAAAVEKDEFGGVPLRDALEECVDQFAYLRTGKTVPQEVSSRRYRLIGRLRQLLARASVDALEPDLVILDEFQRFKDLMSGDDDSAELARALFDAPGCRLLLLSATPFKMYTLPDEPEGEDHYRDFVATIEFLAGHDRARVVEEALGDMRRSLFSGDLDGAQIARDRAERELRRVMCRTERLATTPDRDGMVREATFDGVRLDPLDVNDYMRLSAVSNVLNSGDLLEYWRSSPYVLELMEGYKVKKTLRAHADTNPDLPAAFRGRARGRILQWADVSRYREIDPGNAKMRGLAGDTVGRGAHELAWIPPALPYYELAGAYARPEIQEFTKRLVFSSWSVVPKAISTVLSYDAERRIMSASDPGRAYDRQITPRLTFSYSSGRLAGMPVVALIYPCVTLAEAGDPVAIARELGASFPLARGTLWDEVHTRVGDLVATLPDGGSPDGPVDQAWYWAAPVLLDRERGHLDGTDEYIGGHAFEWHDDESATRDLRFEEHLEKADAVTVNELGRRPDDLVEVLTLQALAAPGVCALRAVARVCGGNDALSDWNVRDNASTISWSLRSLFNQPHVIALVRGDADEEDEATYWRSVLRHSFDGGLQSVLDEYAHVVAEQLLKDPVELAEEVASEICAGLGLRTSSNTFNEIVARPDGVELTDRRTRSHFAVRFGRTASEDGGVQQREGAVRAAFNSPFWPFVLASTSVGQEGLDFHRYSHAVVHWNLPSNPVDLEQREGRVHRYKSHAVRRNVAAEYGGRAEVVEARDPWEAMFSLAAADSRAQGLSDLSPYWVFPRADGAAIERYVPSLPLSKERHALSRLMRTVGAYRLVLGQPRQEDLLRYLGDRVGDLEDLRIDLTPRRIT